MQTKKNKNVGKLSAADLARVQSAQRWHWDIAAKQIVNWIIRTEDATSKVAAGDVRPEMVCVFWIGIYGVFQDVREYVVSHRDLLISVDEEELKAFDLPLSIGSLLESILTSIDEMYALLSEDELAYLELRRHVECHPLQNGFHITVRDGKVIDRRRKITGREWTYEDEMAAFKRVIIKYGKFYIDGCDEAPIARAFAERLFQPLRKTRESMVPVFGA